MTFSGDHTGLVMNNLSHGDEYNTNDISNQFSEKMRWEICGWESTLILYVCMCVCGQMI